MVDPVEAAKNFQTAAMATAKKLKSTLIVGDTLTKGLIEQSRRDIVRKAMALVERALDKLATDRLESASVADLTRIASSLTSTFRPLTEPLTGVNAAVLEDMTDEELEAELKKK